MEWPAKKNLWRLKGPNRPSYRVAYGRDKKQYIVHRVVWEQYCGPIPGGYIVHHKNGDTTDHRIENLACMSPKMHVYIHAAYAGVL